jgi:hypothetical protein
MGRRRCASAFARAIINLETGVFWERLTAISDPLVEPLGGVPTGRGLV